MFRTTDSHGSRTGLDRGSGDLGRRPLGRCEGPRRTTRIQRVAEKRIGTISRWTDITPELSVFKLKPHEGTAFPDYKAGQYIALTREGCRLTTRIKDADGKVRFENTLAEDGTPKLGPVTHSYSIASAPYETKESGELEIYVTLEKLGGGHFGRFTESLFKGSRTGDTLGYVERIVGNFTLDQRAHDFDNVVMVGTGTGLAPFVGMMKQAAHEARAGLGSTVRYTLIHANRTLGELGYDADLRALHTAKIPGFDFVYLPSVSRPRPEDANDPLLSQGRANNLFRLVLGLPTREQEIVEELTEAGSADVAAAQEAAVKATKPRLGSGIDATALHDRMPRGATAVLTCGNGDLMDDIKRIANKANFKFEMEEW
jgi:ferredoxin-NADP reductase